MKFIAIVESDYDFRPMIFYIDTNTKEEAVGKLKKKILGEWYDDDDFTGYEGSQIRDSEGLDIKLTIHLYEVSNDFDVPIKQWFKEAQQRTRQARAKRDEQAEKAELERLKEKYDG